jgi:hypothetical protein
MLGSQLLLIPGVILLAIGLTLQAGAVSSVKAVKLSATLVAARRPENPATAGDGDAHST